MQKQIIYHNTKFLPPAIRRAISALLSLKRADEIKISGATVRNSDVQWKFDAIEEFFEFYTSSETTGFSLTIYADIDDYLSNSIDMYSYGDETYISIDGKSRDEIETVFSAFNECPESEKANLISTEQNRGKKPTIFIGHGRNSQWRNLKDHLQDKHNLTIEAYESGARSGHTIRDILDSMSEKSTFALLILTGEDKTDTGLRARQNVIHECGLFQGRLGFDRAIMLVENGVELASNFDGIQQLRFRKGRISETFGDVLATIRREFGPI